MHFKHNPELTERAKELRKQMTQAERHLWYDFLRQYPVRFLRQKVIDCYIVDFYCAAAHLVVELDGAQHYEETAQKADLLRAENLKRWGLTVIRFSNLDVTNNFDGVCTKIDEFVKGMRI